MNFKKKVFFLIISERKPYKCDVCKMCYNTEKSLNNHAKKSHHPIEK